MVVSHCHSFRGSHSEAEGKCPLRLSGDLSHLASKALCRKCRNTHCHSIDIRHPDVIMGDVALRALLIRCHLESGVQPPRMRLEQRLMNSVWRAEC